MASQNTTRKPKHLQPVQLNPHQVQIQKLGLDWPTVDQIAERYTRSGDDAELVLTIVLMQRLSRLAQMHNQAPESLENFLPLLIDRLYRATHHCEGAAERFAVEADQAQRLAGRPRAASERRAS